MIRWVCFISKQLFLEGLQENSTAMHISIEDVENGDFPISGDFSIFSHFITRMANISAIRNLANEGINLTKDVMGKVMRTVRGNDKRFFNSSKKGEVGEWKKQLHSLNVSEVTNAMKCVIAAMTIGTDVSMLFPDVISCIHDKTLELKKLVYL